MAETYLKLTKFEEFHFSFNISLFQFTTETQKICNFK